MPVLPDLFRRHLLRVHCGHNVEMDVYLRFPSIADNSLVLFAKRDPAKGPGIGLTYQLGCPGRTGNENYLRNIIRRKGLAKISVEHIGEIRMGWNDPSISFQVSSHISIQSTAKQYFKHRAGKSRRKTKFKRSSQTWKHGTQRITKSELGKFWTEGVGRAGKAIHSGAFTYSSRLSHKYGLTTQGLLIFMRWFKTIGKVWVWW